MKALAESVAKLARPLVGKRGFSQAEILLEWAAIVGEDLARVSVPVKLSFPRRAVADRSNGTLHLKVESAAALEIQHLEPQILQRVNGYCGYSAVARLLIRQGPLPRRILPPPPPRPLDAAEETALVASVAGVDDPELRASLTRLGRAVLGSVKRGGA